MPAPFLVHQFLERSAEIRPDHPFLVQLGETSTYAEIEMRANAMAHALLGRGLDRGDRVGLLAVNSPFYVACYYAVLKAGGIAVPLNTAASADGLAEILEDAGARFLICGEKFERKVTRFAPDLPRLEVIFAANAAALKKRELPAKVLGIDEVTANVKPTPPDRRSIDLDLASIVYTSGSTGRPRGATLSHRNLVANASSIVEYLGLSYADRTLDILPFFYVYGKSLLNTHAAVGGTLVIENRFLYPNVALDTLQEEKCTGFSGVPSTFSILLNRSTFAERSYPDLRYVTQAGGAMSPELTRRLLEVLPDTVDVFVMYGATEASARLSYLPPMDLRHKIGSIGKAIPNVELELLRKDGSKAEVGETGEIVARGSNIMVGYWGDPEETAKALTPEGAYHTGDLGRYDEEGFLYVVGRMKDMIKAGAHRIAAQEIEDAILEFDAVHETAVIGAPDEILGEKIVAFVVFQEESVDSASLGKFLKQRLPLYKQPSEIEVRKELPKNSAGKILKPTLRAEYSSTTDSTSD